MDDHNKTLIVKESLHGREVTYSIWAQRLPDCDPVWRVGIHAEIIIEGMKFETRSFFDFSCPLAVLSMVAQSKIETVRFLLVGVIETCADGVSVRLAQSNLQAAQDEWQKEIERQKIAKWFIDFTGNDVQRSSAPAEPHR